MQYINIKKPYWYERKKKLILNPADNRDVLSNYFYRAILVFIDLKRKKKTGDGRRSENFVMKIISFINTIQVVFLGLTDLQLTSITPAFAIAKSGYIYVMGNCQSQQIGQ